MIRRQYTWKMFDNASNNNQKASLVWFLQGIYRVDNGLKRDELVTGLKAIHTCDMSSRRSLNWEFVHISMLKCISHTWQ